MSNPLSHTRRSADRGDSSLIDRLEPLVAERLQFFGAFLREPASVGALVPSSRWLAQAMVQECDLTNAETVVELGPGTGSFTDLILKRIGRNTVFLALELNAENAHGLQRRFPSVAVYNDSAEHLEQYLVRHGSQKADCIISGLPWGNMSERLQERIMSAVLAC